MASLPTMLAHPALTPARIRSYPDDTIQPVDNRRVHLPCRPAEQFAIVRPEMGAGARVIGVCLTPRACSLQNS